jgi:hypothetical protein
MKLHFHLFLVESSSFQCVCVCVILHFICFIQISDLKIIQFSYISCMVKRKYICDIKIPFDYQVQSI